MMWLSIGYLIRNLVRGAIHPTSEEAGILYPLTPFFIKGGSIGRDNDDIHIWGLTGKTVLDILTECYTNSIGSRYEYTFYIIEKMSELRDVLI